MRRLGQAGGFLLFRTGAAAHRGAGLAARAAGHAARGAGRGRPGGDGRHRRARRVPQPRVAAAGQGEGRLRARGLRPGLTLLPWRRRGSGRGERWNAEIAWEFLLAHSSWDQARLRFELHRYLGWPGQAPSYKLGERIWLQARDEAKTRAGAAFSLKDFHSKALSLGCMGLDPLREALARC